MQKFCRLSLRANFYYPFGNTESVGLKAFYAKNIFYIDNNLLMLRLG